MLYTSLCTLYEHPPLGSEDPVTRFSNPFAGRAPAAAPRRFVSFCARRRRRRRRRSIGTVRFVVLWYTRPGRADRLNAVKGPRIRVARSFVILYYIIIYI